MELKKILLIENDEKTALALREQFAEARVDVTILPDETRIKEALTGNAYQIVVLDWHLDDTNNSILARVCLQQIRSLVFIPVVVYTEEKDTFIAEMEDVEKIFPQSLIVGFDKGEMDYSSLLEHLKTIYSQPPLNFSVDLRSAVSISVEQALYSLAEHSIDNLSIGLKTIIKTDPIPEIDIEHTVQVFSRLIERKLYEEKTFIRKLKELVEALTLSANPTTRDEKSRARKTVSSIQDLYMFYKPPEDDVIVRTGDFVEVKLKKGDEQFLSTRAIVITPACDLANPGKTNYLRLALIEDATDNAGKPPESEWHYQDGGKKYKVGFHKLWVLKNIDASQQERPSFVMSYRHNYSAVYEDSTVEIKRQKRLEEPYLADLLHNFVSHAGRIGQPDFSAVTWIPD